MCAELPGSEITVEGHSARGWGLHSVDGGGMGQESASHVTKKARAQQLGRAPCRPLCAGRLGFDGLSAPVRACALQTNDGEEKDRF